MQAAKPLRIHLFIQFDHSCFPSVQGTTLVSGHAKTNSSATKLLRQMCTRAQSLSHIQLFVTLRTAAPQIPLSMRFPKSTEVVCLFLLQGISSTPGLSPSLLRLLYRREDSLPLSHLGSAQVNTITPFQAGLFHVCDGSYLHTWTVSTLMDSQVHYPAFRQLLTWGLGQQEMVNIFLLVTKELLVGFLNLI